MDTTFKPILYEAKDYKSDQHVRWCPGCGDHAILTCLHRAMAMLQLNPHEVAVISGIGCSSRLPYYMNTYGFHTIHGRGAAVATGVKVANPQLSVWLATGDGDCLAIGGNHFIHAVRRNIDINIMLINNKVYGLTKGQYSPTSDRGFVSKSSPQGTIEDPFYPVELTLGARGTFFARCIDVDLKNTPLIFAAAARHQGASVVEVLQNCVIFNDNIHKDVVAKEYRDNNTILLKQGEKMIFGANMDKGIVMDGFKLKVITIGEDGYTLDDVLLHDATTLENTLHFELGMMEPKNGYPLALGVIRNVEAPTYDKEVKRLIDEVQTKNKTRTLHDVLMKGEVWEVK